jgi:PAS domain S-box-containing protein
LSRANDDLLGLLVAETRDYAILTLDVEGNVATWNAGAQRFKGYAAEEIIGRHFSVFYSAEDVSADKPRRELRVAAAEGRLEDEGWRVRKDGSRFWANVVITALRDHEGRLRGYGKVTRDLTERRVHELGVLDREQLYRDLFENSPAGIARVALDGAPLAVNLAWASMMGYDSPEQFMAEVADMGELYEDPAERTAMNRAVLEHGPARGLELRMRRRDGVRVWVALDVGTVTAASGEVIELQGSGVDISERKRVEEALGESEARFRLLAENSRDVIRLYDAELRICYASPSCAAVLGYAPEELVGQQSSELQHPDDVASREGREQAMMAAEDEVTMSYRSRHKDGGYVWLEASVRALRDEHSGAVVGYQEAARDISERKLAEAEIRSAKNDAERANHAKSEFLSRMSHELRTPLNAILGFGQLLERAALEEREHRQVEYILKGGRHLLALIDEVLEISRIEAGNLGVSVEPLLLGRGVEEALELVGPIADQRGIAIQADLEEISGVWVMADLQRLKQVVLNLLSNAIKYNRPAGSIRVSVVLEGETVVLGVSDTGPGIAAADLPRLFVPFDRLGAEASRVEGTGLGLALSRRLAEAMGGSLDARSSLGAGSTFELRLARSAPLAVTTDRAVPETASVGPLRVLYVEDNVSNLQLIEEVLVDAGVEMIAASSGRLALDLARGARADVILLDINLPDMTGEEVLRGLRECPQTATTPVIVLTADATRATRRRMLELGVLAHLNKPIEIDLLKSALAEARVVIAARRRDTMADERDITADERHAAADERGTVARRRDTTADERDLTADERDSAADVRDTAADVHDEDDRDTAADVRDTTADVRDTAADAHDDDERDSATQKRDSAARRRETAAEARRAASGERDSATDERGTAAQRRDSAADERDRGTEERHG